MLEPGEQRRVRLTVAAERVGPAGEWPESVANYAQVSVSRMLPFAIAARNVGLRDFLADARMRRLLLFLAKHYTPPDFRREGRPHARGRAAIAPIGWSPASSTLRRFSIQDASASVRAISSWRRSRSSARPWRSRP